MYKLVQNLKLIPLNLIFFPFFQQELSVVLTSKLNNRNIKLIVTKYGLGFNTKRTFVDQQKWRLLDLVEYQFDELSGAGNENTEIIMYSKIPNVDDLIFIESQITF